MSRVPVASIVIISMLSAGRFAFASDFYAWTDENGVTHFADSPDDVPAKYRAQVKAPKQNSKPTPAVSQGSPVASAVNPSPKSAAENEPASRKFEVPYEAYEGSSRRVILSVTLNDAVTVPMALDTGAPGMVISFQLAERLGLFTRDRNSGTLLVAAGGIGGSTPAVLTIVDSVSVDGARASFIPTTVTESLSPKFQGLLGMDFMSGYTVSIDSTRQVVVFQEISAVQSAPGGHDQGWWQKTFKEFRSTRDRWKAYAESSGTDSIGTHKSVGEFQAREAERLLERLSGYASDNAVPMEWR
jgi:predicted aspartyl protease